MSCEEKDPTLGIVKALSVVFVIVILTAGSCSMYTNRVDNAAIVKLVESGAHPLDAKCAIRGTTSDHECLVRSAK